MGIVRWTPVREIFSIQERINKMFDESIKSSSGDWTPAVDIMENDGEIIIICETPGVSEEDIDIQVAEGVLVVSGEKKFKGDKQEEKYFRLERSFGKFSRSFAIPNAIDTSSIKASLKNGILRITLAKRPDIEPKTIKIEKG